jgi:hypothetical protein
MNAETIIISAMGGLVASVVSTPLGHWLAMRRHVSQRWWERKAEAYNSILLGLAQVRTALVDIKDELLDDSGEVDQAELEKAMKAWDEAAERVGPLGNQGTFIISSEASRILLSLQEPLRTPPRKGEESEWMYRMLVALRDATAAFRAEAKRDLRVS